MDLKDKFALQELRKAAGTTIPDSAWEQVEKEAESVGILGLTGTSQQIVSSIVFKGLDSMEKHGEPGRPGYSRLHPGGGGSGSGGSGSSGGGSAQGLYDSMVDKPKLEQTKRMPDGSFTGGLSIGLVAVSNGEAILEDTQSQLPRRLQNSRSPKAGTYKGNPNESLSVHEEVKALITADRPGQGGARSKGTMKVRRFESKTVVKLESLTPKMVDAVGGPANARALIAMGRTGKPLNVGGTKNVSFTGVLGSASAFESYSSESSSIQFGSQYFMAVGAMRNAEGV